MVKFCYENPPSPKLETFLPEAPKEAKLPPVAPIDDDTSEWDMPLMPAPPCPSGTIKVKLVYAGKDKPLPFDDPSSETE